MKITEPVIIRKLKSRGYEATGTIEGRGVVRRRGPSEEEAKERFFQACNMIGSRPRTSAQAPNDGPRRAERIMFLRAARQEANPEVEAPAMDHLFGRRP
jgi:hypothetical protein